MSVTIDGIRIVDMPDIGVVTDASSVVGEHAGSGRFAATAIRDYVAAYVAANLFNNLTFANIAALRAYAGTTPQPKVAVLGFTTAADVGEGDWLYMPSDSTTADNGGTFVVDAAGHRWRRSGAANSFNVLWFGAKGNGTTNDAPAIQTAINALPPAGGEILFPPRQFAVAATITLGNGSSSATSTRNGIVLRGTAGIESPDEEGVIGQTGTQLLWTGASGGEIVSVAGPTQGCGVRNMLLHGNGIAAYGIVLMSACFGDFQNLSIEACTNSAVDLNVVSGTPAINSMNNRFHNLFINMPDVAGVKGIMLDGDATQNSCFNDFQNMFILLAPTQACWAIYLRGCDSNSFRNMLIYGGSSAATAVIFDYTGAASYFPCSNSFYAIDPYGAGGTANVQQWVNNGAPSANAAPNYIYGLNQANGASLPNLPNLTHNVPFKDQYYQEWTNHTAALAGTQVCTVQAAGLYRIDYNLLVIGGSGTSGTIEPYFGASADTGLSQSIVGQATPGVAVGASSSGSATAHVMAGGQVSTQVVYNTVVGTPAWSLYVNVSRIH